MALTRFPLQGAVNRCESSVKGSVIGARPRFFWIARAKSRASLPYVGAPTSSRLPYVNSTRAWFGRPTRVLVTQRTEALHAVTAVAFLALSLSTR
jgi:hypothetical protein